VLAEEPRPGTPKQPSENERDEDRVVELPGDRDEVRHQVERHREVHEGEHRRDLPLARHARIAQEALEEDGAVRHEPGDHPDVPLSRAKDEGGNERRVHDDHDGDDAEEPAHFNSLDRRRSFSTRPPVCSSGQ